MYAKLHMNAESPVMSRSPSPRLGIASAASPVARSSDEPAAPRATRTDELVAQLADDILHGRLHPGCRLDEQEIARRFGVSRTPVREALGQLAATGLAEKRPHRGVIVAMISEGKLREMFTAMGELEAVAARLSAEVMTPVERHALEALHRSALPLVQAGAAEEYAALNTQFHSILYAGCHNSVLQDMLMSTRRRLAPFRRAQFNIVGRLSSSWAEHDAVVQAILRGDAEAAGRAMRDHVLTVSDASAEYVGAHLPTPASSPATPHSLLEIPS